MATNTTYYNLIKPAYTDTADIDDINTNMDTIDSALHTLDTGKKPKQTAKNDPTASGTSATFIASLSQDVNGVVTATKKTVQSASTSQNGLMSSTDKSKLDGIEAQANKYVLPAASSGALGGIKIGFTESGKKYPVELSSQKAFVEVPWTDTTLSIVNTVEMPYTVGAGDYETVRASYTLPDGFTPFGVVRYNSQQPHVIPVKMELGTMSGSGGALVYYVETVLRNVSSSSKSSSFKATVLCYKKS